MKLFFTFILIFTLGTISLITNAKEITTKSIADHQGKACVIAFGNYRREIKEHCSKSNSFVDWNKLDVSKCIQQKLGPNKFSAIYRVKFNCI